MKPFLSWSALVVALALSPALAHADTKAPAADVSAKTLMRLANGPRSAVQEAASSELSSRVGVRDVMATQATKAAEKAFVPPGKRDVLGSSYMASGAQHDVAVEQHTRAAKLLNRTYAKTADFYQSHHLTRVAEHYEAAAEIAHRGAAQYRAAAEGYAPYSVELETEARHAATRLQDKAWRAEAKAAKAVARAEAIRASRPQKD